MNRKSQFYSSSCSASVCACCVCVVFVSVQKKRKKDFFVFDSANHEAPSQRPYHIWHVWWEWNGGEQEEKWKKVKKNWRQVIFRRMSDVNSQCRWLKTPSALLLLHRKLTKLNNGEISTCKLYIQYVQYKLWSSPVKGKKWSFFNFE